MLYLPPPRSLSSHPGSASAKKTRTKHTVHSQQKQQSATTMVGEASCVKIIFFPPLFCSPAGAWQEPSCPSVHAALIFNPVKIFL